MNKISIKVVLFIMSFAMATNLYATDNRQYILAVDDDNNIMNIMQTLYIDSGMALPSSSGPWSVAELNLMLDQVKINKLNKKSREQYDFLKDQLSSYTRTVDNDINLSFSPEITYEAYSHINTDYFTTRDSWNRGWDEQSPFFTLNFDFMANDIAYSFVNLSIGSAEEKYSKDLMDFGSQSFATNVPFVDPNSAMTLNTDISDRAFIAFGGDNWSAQVGRDQLSWGNGVSGNMMLSDNLEYQNMGRLTFFGKSFKYTYLVSFFPHQMNYVPTPIHTSQTDPLVGFSMFTAHRFEGRLFNNRLGWALSEGNMFASANGTVDMAAFNPLLSYHSLYYKANCNSIVSVDLDLTIGNMVNLYSQLVVDDLVFPIGETKISTWSPDAYGFIFGVKFVNNEDYYKRLTSIEFAYTSPYLYLRSSGDTTTVQDGYGINYIVALRKFTQDGISFEKRFLGYEYGGDAIVFNIRDKMYETNRWSLETNLFLMCHGTFEMNTLWSPVGPAPRDEVTTPTSTNYSDVTKNAPSFTSILGFNYTNKMVDHISAFGQIDFVSIINPDNVYDGTFANSEFDIQLSVGITLKY
ncbi:MAG: hypothetical protein JJE21_00095 [Spirochaetaceae bacterium]|nr:hypothetical protein [Spirochaetaceae bacterium]